MKSSMTGSDPRPGIKTGAKGTTIHKFNANPFEHGGAQEQRDVSAVMTGTDGPSLKSAPKPDRVDDAVDSSEMKRDLSK